MASKSKAEKCAYKAGIKAGQRGAKVWRKGQSPFAKFWAKKRKAAESSSAVVTINTETGEILG